ncbi:hypothetical protein PybrP1_012103 [[Pythium] brassicae (nom. inval.)]|nr:hypothetical protein PybrP1_012103 [[Pythium] brassicae (nom. inval.)]
MDELKAARAATPAARDEQCAVASIQDPVGADDAAHAFKLLHEQQAAELNAKDLLLARKSERIDELLQQLKARDAQLEAQIVELHERDVRATQQQAEIGDLQGQLRKEEEDFSMVAAALEAKEQALARKTHELAAAGDAERQVRKDLDRSQALVRRLERSAEAEKPLSRLELADACVSPRSFHENQLVQLRDDAIAAKSREVWLLSGQNDQLRAELDELEAAMAQLQTAAAAKENDVARKQRRVERLEAELEALQASRAQVAGRERAMEIATSQNQKLLLALAAQERASEELAVRADRAERECAQLRETLCAFLETAAASEADALHRTTQAAASRSAVSGLQDKLQRERRALHAELASARAQSQLETEKLQSELVMRRTKQYELTLRLQDAEARLHVADDARESASEQLLASACRMEELERVLRDALAWKAHLEQQLQSQRADAAAACDALARQLRDAQSEVATLTTQLGELKDALARTRSVEKRLERDVHDAKQQLEAKDALAREQRERVQRLVQEVNREAQGRAELELEQQRLRAQLERVHEEADGAARDADAHKRRADDRHRALRERVELLESECASEQAAKAKLVTKFAEAFAAATTAATTAARTAWLTSECLDLRACMLGDRDLIPLLRMLESAPDALVRVDLRSNRITQDGMRAVAAFVKKLVGWLAAGSSSAGCRCRVRDIDLRHNFVSLDGVRVVAGALESLSAPPASSTTSPSLSSLVKRVVVSNGGRVEWFPDTRGTGEPASGEPVLVVDISANFDADVFVAEARKKTRRRPRDRELALPGASSSNNAAVTQRDAQLQETYGVDLVSSLLAGDSARRKTGSTALEKSKPLLPVATAAASTIAFSDSMSSARSASSTSVQLSATTQLQLVPGTSLDGPSSRLHGSSSLPRLGG